MITFYLLIFLDKDKEFWEEEKKIGKISFHLDQ
jgi:hypothetical protein